MPAGWGIFFIMLLGLGAAGYIGGGVTYNHRLRGAGGAGGASAVQWSPAYVKQLLPHQMLWAEVAGLVRDGARFTIAAAKKAMDGHRGGGGASAADPLVGADAPAAEEEASADRRGRRDVAGASSMRSAPSFASAAAPDNTDSENVVE